MNNVILLKQYGYFLELFFAMICLSQQYNKRKYYWLRVIGILVAAIPFYFLPSMNLFGIDFVYFFSLILLFGLSLFLYKESTYNILFTAVAAFGLQHLAWNVTWIFFDFSPELLANGPVAPHIVLLLIFGFIYGFASLILHLMKIKINASKKSLGSFLFSTIIIFIVLILAQLVTLGEGEWTYITRMYTALAVLLALLIQFGYPYLKELSKKQTELSMEKENLEKMLELQSHQQNLSKETEDIINMKFHDMKQQLILLKGLHGQEKQNTIEELEKAVDVYTDIAKTGNEALDIVLTQKSLSCTNKNIRFTYIIDGKAFDFMSKTDITAMFGNIVDNAVEATDKEVDEFRLIKLQSQSENGFLKIEETNYYHGELNFRNGMPTSSKKDNTQHGYGLKSISYIVEKYNGQLSIEHENNVFHLFILIPIPEQK